MPRLIIPSVPRAARFVPVRAFAAGQRSFAETSPKDAAAKNSKPGWHGRHGDEHVLYRDKYDMQSEPSHQARRDKEQGKAGDQGVSEKDERNSNQRAHDEHPEAPGPVIGMNSERGAKGH